MRLLAPSLVVLLVVPPGGAWRQDRDEARFRELARDPVFAPVGRIEGRGRHLGSVVLVANRWVVTDAHVVTTRSDGQIRPMGVEDLTVFLGRDTVGVRSITVHAQYWAPEVAETEDVLARKGVDVAVLELAAPIEAVAPASLLDAPVEPGTEVTFVGFGTAGTAHSVVADPLPAGTKRAGTNTIDQIGGSVGSRRIPSFLLVCDFDAPGTPSFSRTGSAEPTDLEYLPLGGDSGGAAFVRTADGWRLAGLVATVTVNIPDDPADGIYGSVAYATAVGAFRGFLERVIGR